MSSESLNTFQPSSELKEFRMTALRITFAQSAGQLSFVLVLQKLSGQDADLRLGAPTGTSRDVSRVT